MLFTQTAAEHMNAINAICMFRLKVADAGLFLFFFRNTEHTG